MADITTAERLDVTGRTITTYIAYEAAKRFEAMELGEVLDVISDDYAPIEHDLRAWCASVGHTIESVDHDGATLRFRIAKGPGRATAPKRLAMVISDPGLEELLSPLAFALAAALEGDAVDIYFQGPAVRVLVRGFTPKLHGWGRPGSAFARKGMAKAGHSEPHVKLRQLESLGARFYACGGSLDHFRVSADDFVFPDIPVVEYLTFMAVMREADVQIFLQ